MSERAGRVTALGYTLGWRAMRAVPAGVAEQVFRAGADLAARRDGAGVRQLRANLARVLGRPPAEELVTEAMRSYARYWREVFRLPVMDPAALHEAVNPGVLGVEHLEAALGAGRGVVLALTHSGNWDSAGVWLIEALRRRGRPPTLVTVAERLRPDSLYRRFVAYRESLGFELLPAGGGAAGARAAATLVARLRAGGVVCLLADRELSDGGVEVSFFGEPARLPGGPAQLARRTGAALLPVAGWFTPGGWGYRVHPPVQVGRHRDGSPGTALRTATQALADVFAADIAEHPTDWHMLQPVWSADRNRARGGAEVGVPG